MTIDSRSPPIRIAFVCVQNAGRSQMASAFAERELETRELEGTVALRMGGTHPADRIHPEVTRAMQAVGIDLAGRTPRDVPFDELRATDLVITMGCAAEDVCPADWAGHSRDWNLEDPHGRSEADVATIRDEIDRRVEALFDELEDEL